MRQNESITKIMATDLVTATPKDTFSAVHKRMQESAIHHIPVVEGAKLIGLISRMDILKYTNSQAFVRDEASNIESLDSSVSVSDIMSKNLITLKDTKPRPLALLPSFSDSALLSILIFTFTCYYQMVYL